MFLFYSKLQLTLMTEQMNIQMKVLSLFHGDYTINISLEMLSVNRHVFSMKLLFIFTEDRASKFL